MQLQLIWKCVRILTFRIRKYPRIPSIASYDFMYLYLYILNSSIYISEMIYYSCELHLIITLIQTPKYEFCEHNRTEFLLLHSPHTMTIKAKFWKHFSQQMYSKGGRKWVGGTINHMWWIPFNITVLWELKFYIIETLPGVQINVHNIS